MNILEEIKKYPALRPHEDQVVKALKTPMKYCPEEILMILPSIALGSDGTILSSLFFVTQNYLGEVRLNEKREDFDFIARNSIRNCRFILSEHLVKSADESEVNYKIATIKFYHDIGGIEFASELSYVGTNEDERDLWIRAVTKALPFSLLLSNQREN